MNYYVADTHFGAMSVLPYRPFASTKEMDEVILDRINNSVGRNDTLFIVGDAFGYNGNPALIRRIRADVVLVPGNHDVPLLRKRRYQGVFSRILPTTVTVYDATVNRKFFLCHYPCCSWDGAREGVIHLYGHLHARTDDGFEVAKWLPNAVNVGVDVNDFRPLTGKEVLRRTAEQNRSLANAPFALPTWPRCHIVA